MFLRSLIIAALALAAVAASAQRSAPPRVIAIDRVIAIVNDEAITQYELDDARSIVLQQLKQQNVQQPATDVLDKQVLERLITERALLQYAKDSGIKVDDTQVERAMQRIAEDNKLTLDGLRQTQAGRRPVRQVSRGCAQEIVQRLRSARSTPGSREQRQVSPLIRRNSEAKQNTVSRISRRGLSRRARSRNSAR
jgi:hypothetical protein